MLIFCCGMPRSGGTLLYQLTKEICEQNDICRGRGFPNRKYKSGVVKTDTCQPWMINRVKNGALAFGTYRDFRDIVVSLQKFYTRRSKERLGIDEEWSIERVLGYRASILDIYYCWQPYAAWFRYEDLDFTANIVNGVSRILEIEITPEQRQAIIGKYNLVGNLKRIKQQKPWMEAGGGSMLTKIHISSTKGLSTWRKVLSKEDLKKVMAVGGEWLKEHGYE